MLGFSFQSQVSLAGRHRSNNMVSTTMISMTMVIKGGRVARLGGWLRNAGGSSGGTREVGSKLARPTMPKPHIPPGQDPPDQFLNARLLPEEHCQ